MRVIQSQPSLVDQVVEAITSEIISGELPSNARLIQDELARAYGVSRQPVQQALLLLRSRGLVREAEGRGLIVAPLDLDFIRNLYEIRAVVEGLAARLAASNGCNRAEAEGPRYIADGLEAVKSGLLDRQIEADIAFHAFLSELSGNPLINETTAPHWPSLRRVMGEVLRDADEMPYNTWDEHAAILDAIVMGDGAKAEQLSRDHILRTAGVFITRLKAQQDLQNGEAGRRRIKRTARAASET
ncbi:GntR family transcriptional regulator [Xanthobacter oligotrophicus]|uniref:GntR family transcriptional regulator n=1 Tax=Xanthobacter oligotrophicus TaxID=2607286 RepID=A0ABW7A1S1_9HYPH